MSTPTRYQRVGNVTVTPSDYALADDNGIPFSLYLKTDGIDDGMLTNSIDFSATDKMTVWAGVRKLSDAAAGMFVELSANAGSNNGTFYITGPETLSKYGVQFGGTSHVTNVPSTLYAAPISNIITGLGDISAPSNKVRINGADVNTLTTSQGTGNFGNYPLYLFRRVGPLYPFNGRFYGLIVRGAQSTAAQISSGEKYLNTKTKAY